MLILGGSKEALERQHDRGEDMLQTAKTLLDPAFIAQIPKTYREQLANAYDSGDAERIGRVQGQVLGILNSMASPGGVFASTSRFAQGAKEIAAAEKLGKNAEQVAEVGSKFGSNKGAGAVKELEVSSYKDLKSRGISGDGLEHDHIPSFAALKMAREQELGRSLTNYELRDLYNNATAVEIPRDVHQAGRTYGGKNTIGQISQDAKNLCTASSCDTAVLKINLLNRGYDPKVVQKTIDLIIQRNKNIGVIK